MKLNNRTILITGGTSGIGLELASRLLHKGNTVIITGREPAKFEKEKAVLAGAHFIQSNVGDPDAIATLYNRLISAFPRLDTLINNAGIMRNIDLTANRSLIDVTKEIDINLSGPIRMIQQFLPHLITRENSLIVNVSSGLAFVPLPISPVYCATKAALHSFTQSLRIQLAQTNVHIVELAPPAVETALLRAEFADEMRGQKAMSVKELVDSAISGIEAGRVEIRPGLSNALAAISRVAPEFGLAQMAKMGKKPA